MAEAKEKAPQIYKAITAMMKDIGAISRDQKNVQQGFKYRGIDQVYNALQPLLAKHKIFTVPSVLTVERAERKSKSGGALFYTMMTVQYKFYTDDGSYVMATVRGEAMDSGDKGANKALAVAHKYALLQVFAIPTEDDKDPDATMHEIKPEKQAKSKTTRKTPKPTGKDTKKQTASDIEPLSAKNLQIIEQLVAHDDLSIATAALCNAWADKNPLEKDAAGVIKKLEDEIEANQNADDTEAPDPPTDD